MTDTDTTTKPNAALAYAVLDHIDAHPEQWNQNEWWCRTGGCFAGWTCVLSGDEPVHDGCTWQAGGRDVSERAAELLGFDDEEEMHDTAFAALGHPGDEFDLFNGGNDRADLGRIVEALFGPRPEGQP